MPVLDRVEDRLPFTGPEMVLKCFQGAITEGGELIRYVDGGRRALVVVVDVIPAGTERQRDPVRDVELELTNTAICSVVRVTSLTKLISAGNGPPPERVPSVLPPPTSVRLRSEKYGLAVDAILNMPMLASSWSS